MKKIMLQEELLQWRSFQQISWQGQYKILSITNNTMECILGDFLFRIKAEHFVIEQLHTLFFCISFNQLQSFEVVKHDEK